MLLPCGQSIESDRSNDPQCKQSVSQSTYWSLRADRSCCCPHQTTQSVGTQYVQYLACLTANSRLGLVLSLRGRQFSAISQHCSVLASVHNDNGPSHQSCQSDTYRSSPYSVPHFSSKHLIEFVISQ